MKAAILMGVMVLGSISAHANSSTYSHKCITDTGKNVDVTYTGYRNFRLDKVVIDGATYTTYSSLIVTRDGSAMVFVPEFRGGSTLQLTIQGAKDSYYTLEGKNRGMTCQSTSGDASGI